MKNALRIILYIFILILICFQTVSANENLVASVYIENFGNINIQDVNGKNYLFLPSFADLENLRFNFEDNSVRFIYKGNSVSLNEDSSVNLLELTNNKDFNELTVQVYNNNFLFDLTILKSENVPAISLTPDDMEKGIEFLNDNKKNKLSGHISMVDFNGEVIYNDKLKEIKGRGNSTWENSTKKPYQIKLEKGANLLNNNDVKNVDKTWILLANNFDPTLLRDQFSYNLALEMGMNSSPECRPVDLYFNSEYIGAYTLSEKVEVSSGRIDIYNLEKELDTLNVNSVTKEEYDVNKYGNKFKFSSGVILPENYENGFLLEYEYEDRVDEESCWFSTSNGSYIVIKSPEKLPKEVVAKISEYYQEYEDAIFNKGVNPENGKSYKEYVDFSSLVKLFTIEQFSKDIDTFMASTFMYLDNDNKFNFNTVWDFDIAYGIGSNDSFDDNQKTSGFAVFNTKISEKLLEIDSFKDSFREYYNNDFSKIIDNFLSEDFEGKYLCSINDYVDKIYMSQKLNSVLWDYVGYDEKVSPWIYDNYYENVNYLWDFIYNRNLWFKNAINDYNCLEPIKEIKIYSYYDEVKNETYYSLGERDYYLARFVSVNSENIVIKHLSGLNYSEDLKIYVNNEIVNFYKGELNTLVINIPDNHLVMPQKKTDIYFKDVADNSWYYDYVYNVYNKGWMKGVTDKRFQPDSQLKKGMVVTALYRLMENDNSFIKYAVSSECYNNASNWAVEKGIIPAQENDYMYLSNQITRQEAAEFFYRSSNSPEIDLELNFTDMDDIKPFYEDAIKWCVKNGILEGDNKQRVSPDKYLTRAEFTKMLSVYGNILNK